jgi:signal transduction histidine kinase
LNKHLVKLRKAEKEAKESDMLKTAFLQNISHEIRTPMNSIIGFSDLLKEDNLPENKRKEFLEIISYSSNQLLRIVNDLLDIALIETGNVRVAKDKVHINKMIDEIYLSFNNHIKGDISFFLLKELSDDQCFIYTDENKLRQILTNLVNNAIKFTESGYIKFGYKLKKDILEFFIEDTGIGIPHDMQDKIFNRFLKADQNEKKLYPGVGLGLSICKGNAEVINGHIRVESSPGKGSVFFVSIPYKPAT